MNAEAPNKPTNMSAASRHLSTYNIFVGYVEWMTNNAQSDFKAKWIEQNSKYKCICVCMSELLKEQKPQLDKETSCTSTST